MKVEIYDLKLCSRTAANFGFWNEIYSWVEVERTVKVKDFALNLKRLLSTFDLPETIGSFCRQVVQLCSNPGTDRVQKLFVAACDLWLPVFDLVEVADRLDLLPIAQHILSPLRASFGVALSVISYKDIPTQ